MSTLTSTEEMHAIQLAEEKQINDANRAWFAVTVGVLVASFAAVLMRAALDAGLPALLISTGRLAVAFAILTPLVLLRHRADLRAIQRRHLLWALFAGFWISLHFGLLALSLQYTKVIVSQVLVNTVPLWAAFLETFILRTRLPRPVWYGMILAMLGGLIVGATSLLQSEPYLLAMPASIGISDGSATNPPLGALMAIASALSAATYLTIGRKVRADIPIVAYVWLLYGSGALTGGIILALTGTTIGGHATIGYVWMLLVALGPQLISHSGFNYALGHLPATVISLSGQFVSVTAPIIAFILFAEAPTWVEVGGSGIILCGVLVAILGQRTQKRRARLALQPVQPVH